MSRLASFRSMTPARSARTLLAALALGIASGAGAQPASTPDAPSDALYGALGGQAGVKQLADDFVARMLADPRVAGYFKDVKLSRLREQLASQFCAVSGGPCVYTGDDMKSVHEGLKLGKADFNAVVEILQNAMDAGGVPFRAQNQFLARLAPMHRDIVTQ